MDKQEFMRSFEGVLRVCLTNDVTTEAEDGMLVTAKEMLAALPDRAFEKCAEAQSPQKFYPSVDDAEDGLELYAVEVEWDYLKTIGVRASSEEQARVIADDLDRLGIINPDSNCRIEGEEARIVDVSQMCDGCPIYSDEDCRKPEPAPKTEEDRMVDLLLGRDLLGACSRIAGTTLTWQSAHDIWELYEKVRVAHELAYRLVNSDEGYHERYAMIGRDIFIGRMSPTEWFESAFDAYWNKPQFDEDFDDLAIQAWEESLRTEPQKGAQGERPED